MSDQHEDELMNDRELQRELETLLAVRPSPALAARVRAEIAREPVPVARWWWQPSRSMVWGLAAAAGVVLTLVNWWLVAPLIRPSLPGNPVASTSRPAPSPSSSLPAPTPAPSLPAAQPPAGSTVARTPADDAGEAIGKHARVLRSRPARAPLPVQARAGRSAPASTNAIPREPEVLVAADEVRALRALVARGREGYVQAGAIETAPAPSAEFAGPAWTVRPLDPVMLNPIQFDPVPRVGGQEGVQQ